MTGLFIPGITAEMFRNGCLESIEALMTKGKIYDIEYPLEQEPCEDCISRQEAIDAIDALYLDGDSAVSFRASAEGDTLIGKYQAITVLDDLQPTTPQPKTGWIPVSERLPEKNVWVLVTVEQGDNRHQEIMRRNKYIEAWTDGIDNYTDVITAWMPLPEPYKEE